MKKLLDFLKNFRRAIVWTVFYALVMWVILRYLFNFDMFSMAHWKKLLTVELHGFGGLVFGILMLAAIPLYVATMVLTIRNKSVPIKVPVPKCFTPVPEPVPAPPPPVVIENEALPELPQGVPAEMRESFMRAKKNYGARQQSVFNRMGAGADKTPTIVENKSSDNSGGVEIKDKPIVVTEKVVAPSIENTGTVESGASPEFPIPTNFDVDTNDTTQDFGVPVFSDINFDDDKTEEVEQATESETTPNMVGEMLKSAGVNARVDGDLIKTDKFAIAVHGDEDFWVADELDWFASGKQKHSPIVELMAAHKADGLSPILYLACDGIMDLDKLAPEWEKMGIKVIRDGKALVDSVSG